MHITCVDFIRRRRKRTNERNAFICIIYSFFRSFCLTTPSHVLWIKFHLSPLVLSLDSHAHMFLFILTRAFFILFDSIFRNHVSLCLIFIASSVFFLLSVAVLEFKMNLCMQHPSYFCSSSSHTSQK